MAQPWDRIEAKGKKKGETACQYDAFHTYLLLPATERSISKAAAKLRPEKNNTTTTSLFKRYSKRWKWVERAAAYDTHVAEQETRLAERRRVGMLERRLKFEERVQDILEKRVIEMDAAIAKLLSMPATDIEVITADGDVKKVKGVRGLDIAALQDKLVQAAKAAVNGMRPADATASTKKDDESPAPVVGTFSFVKAKKKPAKKPRGEYDE